MGGIAERASVHIISQINVFGFAFLHIGQRMNINASRGTSHR